MSSSKYNISLWD